MFIRTKGVKGPDNWNEYIPCKTCDSPTSHDWKHTRTVMYLTRPNIQLRTRIRVSLRNLMRMNQPGKPIRIHDIRDIDRNRAYSTYHLHPPVLQHECVGMHIRNCDSISDYRGKSGIIRSIEAHIGCMRNSSV